MEHRVIRSEAWNTGSSTGLMLACQCGRVIIGVPQTIVERWDRHLRGE